MSKMKTNNISKAYSHIFCELIFSIGLILFALFLGTNRDIRYGDKSHWDNDLFCVIGLLVSLAVIILIIAIWKYRSFKMREATNAVYVLICGESLWLDTDNLKDELLCAKYYCGPNQIQPDNHYFTHMNALKVAEKNGKRLMTDEEQAFIVELPCRWDYQRKGCWITFDLVYGATTEVFFPAAGYISPPGELLDVISTGYYWSDYNKGLSGHYFHFNSTTVNARNVTSHEHGFSVRCVYK